MHTSLLWIYNFTDPEMKTKKNQSPRILPAFDHPLQCGKPEVAFIPFAGRQKYLIQEKIRTLISLFLWPAKTPNSK